VPVSTSVAVLRRRIAVSLRSHRENTGMTQREAASLTGIAATRINHFETMRSVPPDKDATELLELYGVAEETAEFLELLKAARKRTPNRASATDPNDFDLYIGLESGATRIESYNALVLHGLVQTADYAEALLRGHGQALPEKEIRRQLRLRLHRQEVLRSDPPLQLWLVVSQHVLETPVGGPEVMRAQLAHLRELADLPNVEIQVLPREIVPYAAMHGAFTIMSFPFPGDAGLVYVETRARGLFFEETSHLLEYAQVLNYLRVSALSPEESIRLFESIRKETP
jgi:transcriptional regulator with XRE-family HTH domain